LIKIYSNIPKIGIMAKFFSNCTQRLGYGFVEEKPAGFFALLPKD